VVDQRRREVRIRIALGAPPMWVIELIAKQGFLPVALGIAAGLGAATSAARLLTSVLYEMSPNDPLVYASITEILILATIAAIVAPARRAATVDPVIASARSKCLVDPPRLKLLIDIDTVAQRRPIYIEGETAFPPSAPARTMAAAAMDAFDGNQPFQAV